MDGARDLLLCDMPGMLGKLYADLDKAQRRIWIEVYIFLADDFGSAFAKRLCAAKERGVECRVLYDPLGSFTSPANFFEEMCGKGVDFRPYRPAWEALGSGHLAPRDHGRIFLLDDIVYTGGAAWALPWAPKEEGGGGWHDVNVRVEGPVVGDFEALFLQRWGEAKAGAPNDFDTQAKYDDVRLVGDTPQKDDSLVYNAYVDAIKGARERIWIANAYFVPPPPMLQALLETARRGVEVRVMLPGVSDLGLMRRAARSEYGRWLDGGFRIFEYQNVVMHSKFAIVDDVWCTVGTFNANSSSLGAANEVNLFIKTPRFIADCVRQFEKDLGACVEIDRAMVSDRSFLQQAVDQAANDVMALLDWAVGPSSQKDDKDVHG